MEVLCDCTTTATAQHVVQQRGGSARPQPLSAGGTRLVQRLEKRHATEQFGKNLSDSPNESPLCYGPVRPSFVQRAPGGGAGGG